MLASHPSTASHERIGRYEVLRKIATGGMAELFLAKQVGMEGFEKVVAIKRILAHLAYDEEFINMFRDEARIVAKLSHPNIVQIYDLGKSDETYFIAMEYIPGRNLSSVAKKAKQRGQAMPPEYIARCLAQACEGLYYAHTRKDIDGRPLKIVHRDVSPQNIIVSFSGTVKLVDFGIAKAATKIAHTRAGVLKGKYAYMSPEQIRGEETDARSDLFACGIVIYELLCGRRPFEKDNSIQTLKAIVQEKHLDCRALNPAIPDALAAIIDRALEKDPNTRYQNAQELQIALEDFVSASPIRCNNITISRWVSDLFSEELSREKGGTVVFQGIGEVILPDVLEGAPDPKGAADPQKAEASSESARAAPELEKPLTRGRGGGSIEPRPPIQAPSNRLRAASILSGQTADARRNLIEEGVIEHRVDARDHWEDDATVHAGQGSASREESTQDTDYPVPSGGRYDDGKTEFAKGSAEGPADPFVLEPGGDRGDLGEAPGSDRAPEAELEIELDAEPSSGGALAPLGADQAFDVDDPWDEATIGFPEGGEPEADSAAAEPRASAPLGATRTPAIVAEAVEPDDVWGDLSGSFEVDATMNGRADLWDDKTASGDAFLEADELPEPVVEAFAGRSDSGGFGIDFDDEPSEEIPGDATITQPALADSLMGDATLAMPSISEGAEDDDDEEPDRTLGGLRIELDRDPEPSLAEEDATAPPGSLQRVEGRGFSASDATLAGAPAVEIPDDELSEPSFDFDPEMDEEPELPVPRSDRDVDLDARTVAGVTSDFLAAGLNVPVGGAYDPHRHQEVELEIEPSAVPSPSPPPKRGQERLGAIKLQKVALHAPEPPGEAQLPRLGTAKPARGFTSEEVTEGEGLRRPEGRGLSSRLTEPDRNLDRFAYDEAPLVQPSPLDEPEEERQAPSRSASVVQDEYDALLAPQVPAPLGPSMLGGIGSTNVPPASLSLSQVLAHPGRPPRPGLVAIPKPQSPSPGTLDAARARSASVLGRQIREVVRSDLPAPARALPLAEVTPPMGEAPLARPEFPPMVAAPPPPRRGLGRLWLAAVMILGVLSMAGLAYLALPLILGPDGPQLSIKSTPPGARIFVDGRLQEGSTPLTLTGLEPGRNYEIRIEREGYEPVSRALRVPENKQVLVWPIQLEARREEVRPSAAAPAPE